MSRYVVLVQSREARSGTAGRPIMTADGEWFVVVVEPEGWVEATSQSYKLGHPIPADAKPFFSKEAAERFAQRWKGHPWWCEPNGNYQVLEVKPKIRVERHVVGYEIA